MSHDSMVAGSSSPAPSPSGSPIVSTPRINWPLTALVAVVVIGFLIGAVWLLVAGLSRMLPAEEVGVTLVDTNSYLQSRSTATVGVPRTIYEVIGVTDDGKVFTITSKDLYDAYITQMPVEGTGEVARLTGGVTRVEVGGISGGGATGTGVLQLLGGLGVLAMALFVAYGVLRTGDAAAFRVSGAAMVAAVAIGAVLGVLIAFATQRDDDASARQLAAGAGEISLPQDGELDIGEIDVDVDISLPELDLGLDTTVTPLPAGGAQLGAFQFVVDEVRTVNGGVIVAATITNVTGTAEFELVTGDLYLDGERIDSDFQCADGSLSGFGLGAIEPGASTAGLICMTPPAGTPLTGTEVWVGEIGDIRTKYSIAVP